MGNTAMEADLIFEKHLPRRPLLARLGDAMARHQSTIQMIHWSVVGLYVFLVAAPAFRPLPSGSAHIWNNLTLFAQFIFWGIWWPFVMLSTMVLGRVWCGLFCPEGTLTEFASRQGLGRTIPKWIRWGGWPSVAFTSTTVFGQLISVYQYPKAAILILGGSTLMAVVVGFVYGRGKRVWCMYLCPANGVFRLLARLAPVHFLTDENAWRRAPESASAVDCAPLIDIRRLNSAAACHACGRCSGHRGAVSLTIRSPNSEILAEAVQGVSRAEALMLLFGVIGIAAGTFQWSASPWYVAAKQAIGGWLVNHDVLWPLGNHAPWWFLTHYPETGDVFTWLDGFLIVSYIGAVALLLGGWAFFCLSAAAKVLGDRASRWKLAMGLVPLGGIGIFLGLSSLTVGQLKPEGLSFGGLGALRATLLGAALAWSGWLTVGIILRQPCQSAVRRFGAWSLAVSAMGPVAASWVLLFWVW